MSDFLRQVLGLDQVSKRHLLETLVHLVAASALGGIVAYRPWRKLMTGRPMPPIETAQAQTLISAAGALMVAVIGDSMARAFGLVGLGAFIRFRAGIKDPRDAAVMFVMIGVGMACGLGHVPMAAVAAGFAIVVLVLFDLTGKARPRHVRVAIETDDPRAALPLVRGAFPGARLVGASNETGKGKIVLEVDAKENVDAGSVLELLQGKGVTGVRNVVFEED